MKRILRKRKLIKDRLISTQKRQTSESSRLRNFFEHGKLFRFIILFLTFLFILTVLSLNWNTSGIYIFNCFTSNTFQPNEINNYALLFVGISIFSAIICINISQFLNKFNSNCFKNNFDTLLGIIIFTISLLMSKFLFIILRIDITQTSLTTASSTWLYYLPLFPCAMGAILYGILMNIISSYIFIIGLCLCQGVLFGGDFTIFLITIFSASIGIMASYRASRRIHVIRAGLFVALIQCLFIIAKGLIYEESIQPFMLQSTIGLFNGLAAAFFATGFLPILEHLFQVTTDIRLVELSDLNHPLLKRLVINAPGTYHHSLIVGNLAEAAAEAVGANPILARVGAYFHDIGKLKKPEYFSENEWMGTSRHDDLIPSMSSLIIISHVKDGVDLAKKNGLNKEIVDIIEQHHGTGVVYFFYKRAEKALLENQKIDVTEYRYPGPLPQTKEAAIILIADAVEASSRALENPTPARIKNLVNDIINSRFIDSQLDECSLTIQDLSKLRDCFTLILTGIFHMRPKYPKDDEQEEKKNGNSDPQSPEKVPDQSKND